MEIIKKGKLKSEQVYEATCYECETKVRFQRKEAKFTDDQRDGSFLTVKCPVCKSDIHVNL